MPSQQQQPIRYGQQVRILECPQNHPAHQGQVGTVSRLNKRMATATVRVHVGMGICQATAVEALSEDAVAVTRTATHWPMLQPMPGT